MHVESKYVLFLDDDVRLHPGTIGALVACMEEEPKVSIPDNCIHILSLCELIDIATDI